MCIVKNKNKNESKEYVFYDKNRIYKNLENEWGRRDQKLNLANIETDAVINCVNAL